LIARSAPSRAQAAHFSAEPAVAKTARPIARASWIAVVPMPDDPPWTRNRSPARSPPRMKTLDQTVKKVSHRQAASRRSIPAGTGRAWAAWSGVFGIAAAGQQRADRSPTFQRVTPGPMAATSPAASSPGRSEAPGGGA
jgi:hypothetical protein